MFGKKEKKEFDPKMEALRISLVNMFKSNYFNICTIDAAKKLMGIDIDNETDKIMRTLHCVHYSNMSPEMKKWLIEKTLEEFNKEPITLDGELLNNKQILTLEEIK